MEAPHLRKLLLAGSIPHHALMDSHSKQLLSNSWIFEMRTKGVPARGEVRGNEFQDSQKNNTCKCKTNAKLNAKGNVIKRKRQWNFFDSPGRTARNCSVDKKKITSLCFVTSCLFFHSFIDVTHHISMCFKGQVVCTLINEPPAPFPIHHSFFMKCFPIFSKLLHLLHTFNLSIQQRNNSIIFSASQEFHYKYQLRPLINFLFPDSSATTSLLSLANLTRFLESASFEGSFEKLRPAEFTCSFPETR